MRGNPPTLPGGWVNLIVPAYCLAEPNEKLARQARDRRDLQRNLETELRQLARTGTYKARITGIQDITSLLIKSNEDEKKRFNEVRNRLVQHCEIISLTTSILIDAAKCEERLGLTPQDAMVYASVIYRLQSAKAAPSCFLNRNAKDFDDPDIVDELRKNQCLLIPRFDQGLAYIQSRSQKSV